MTPESFWAEFIKDDFEKSYVPRAYEVVARQFLVRKNLEGQIKPVLYKVGTYFYDDRKNHINGEFDVVTLSKKGYDFYEVKYTKKPVDDAVVHEEEYQLNRVGVQYNRMGFFSKSGFSISDAEKFILYTLDDVYR